MTARDAWHRCRRSLASSFQADLFRATFPGRGHMWPHIAPKLSFRLTFDARPWLPSIVLPNFVLSGTWDPVVPRQRGP